MNFSFELCFIHRKEISFCIMKGPFCIKSVFVCPKVSGTKTNG